LDLLGAQGDVREVDLLVLGMEHRSAAGLQFAHAFRGGGLGAFGGFVIPPILGFAVRDLGERGYAIGFITFVFLALVSLVMVWILKYAPAPAAAGGDPAGEGGIR
jgi:hypothetical protein